MSRYNRHIILDEIGQEGQDKIAAAKVLIIGAGGLGCPVLQYLAAAGIGHLGIVDFDLVEESNLQRQILFGTTSLGTNKAIAAKIRLEDLNPTITITAYPKKLNAKNALTLFKQYDIIVDGSDNFATRYLISDAAIITNKPVVYGAIYKFEGQVSVFNYDSGPSYRCLFANPPKEGQVANCSDVGVLGVLPGIIGSMQANEVLKIVLQLGEVLSGKLFCYNAKTTSNYTLKVFKSHQEITQVLTRKSSFHEFDYEAFCQLGAPEITAKEALAIKNVQFIDVREVDEQPFILLENCLHIPLGNLAQNIGSIDSAKSNVLVCQTGIRSRNGVSILNQFNLENCYSLTGGASALLNHLKVESK
jgi:adenylyltransferase/sulfurtransferase